MRSVLRATMALFMFCAVILIGSAPISASTQARQAAGWQSGKYQHIFIIMMENQGVRDIIGNTADAPYINWLATHYSISLDYYGVTHPSSPNYLASISGNFYVWDDCPAGANVTCAPQEFGPTAGYTNGLELLTPQEIATSSNTPHMFSAQNIVDQLEAHGLTWKAYMQSMPYAGYTGADYPIINGKPEALYVQKHNPFEYFSDIRNNPARMQKIVPFTQLATDLSSGNVPNYVWISPDTCHDMHGMSTAGAAAVGEPNCAYPPAGVSHALIQAGDSFLRSTVTEIMHSSAWSQRSAIVITWDEDDYSSYNGCCHSPTGMYGVTLGGSDAPFIAITSKGNDRVVDYTTPYNHYSLLATIEKLWGLGCLQNACGFSDDQLMTKFFES